MPVHFTKMHAVGNDFVCVGVFDQTVADPSGLARAVCDRRRGVGCDGLILVGPAADDLADVRMEVYNADGSRAEMCGNGIRCVGKLAFERGWAGGNVLRVLTDAGVCVLDLAIDSSGRIGTVRVDMGTPILDPGCIPVALAGEQVVDRPLVVDGTTLRMTCISMGNPHAVFFVDDLAGVPLGDWGARIEHHSIFPRRVNVHFVEVNAPGNVRMIHWERGSGATQACGSGACAACVAGVLTGRTKPAICVGTPGGELAVQWDRATGHVFLTGTAVEVFRGEWGC